MFVKISLLTHTNVMWLYLCITWSILIFHRLPKTVTSTLH